MPVRAKCARRIGGTLHVSVRIYMITGCNHRVASLEGNSGLLLIQSACKVCAHARCVPTPQSTHGDGDAGALCRRGGVLDRSNLAQLQTPAIRGGLSPRVRVRVWVSAWVSGARVHIECARCRRVHATVRGGGGLRESSMGASMPTNLLPCCDDEAGRAVLAARVYVRELAAAAIAHGR